LEYHGAKKDRERRKVPVWKVSDLHAHADGSKLPKEGILYVYHLDKGSKAVPFAYFLNYKDAGIATEHNEGNIKTENELLLPGDTKWKVSKVETLKDGKRGVAETVHVVHLRPE